MLVVFTGVLFLPPLLAKAEQDDPILIHADKAWEGDQGDVLYFEGNFSMQNSQWHATGDRAEMTGTVDDPSKIVIYGEPARIRKVSTGDIVVSRGHGDQLVYHADSNILELHGDAAFTGSKATIASSIIIYDLDNEQLRSTGEGGVKMVVQPSAIKKRKTQDVLP